MTSNKIPPSQPSAVLTLLLTRDVPSAHIPAARDCLARFLGVSRHCLKEREQAGLNVTLDMVDSAIQFICHRDGDRVACEYQQFFKLSSG